MSSSSKHITSWKMQELTNASYVKKNILLQGTKYEDQNFYLQHHQILKMSLQSILHIILLSDQFFYEIQTPECRMCCFLYYFSNLI